MQKPKFRNLLLQVLLMIFSFGLYALYWFYVTACELRDLAGDRNASPVLWLVLLFVPFGFIYSFYKYAELYERASSDKLNKWLLIVLWIFCGPAVWLVVQLELNKRALEGGSGVSAV